MSSGHTDISEKGLERLICTALTGSACDPGTVLAATVHERLAASDVIRTEAAFARGAGTDFRLRSGHLHQFCARVSCGPEGCGEPAD